MMIKRPFVLPETAVMGCCVCVMAVAMTVDVAVAQLPGAPIDSPPLGRAIGLTPQIRDILQQTVVAYRDGKSYADHGEVWITQTNGLVRQTTQMPSRILLRRPNLIKVISGAQSISCDGKTLQIVLDNLRQYTSTSAPQRVTMSDIRYGAPGGGLDEGYPEVLEFLTGENVYQRWVQRIDTIKLGEPANLNNRPCQVIQYQSAYKSDVTLYIDDVTSLLLRCEIDATEAMYPPGTPRPGPGEPQPRLEIRYDLFPVEVNGKISGSPFEVVPPAGMQLVRQFQNQPPPAAPPASRAEPTSVPSVDQEGAQVEASAQGWVGRTAPSFQGLDLDGQLVDARVFEDKVALLFFWSPTGDLGSLSAIQMVQRVSERFKDDSSVSFLSISAKTEHPDLVRDLLKIKRATYRTISDKDDMIAQTFGLEGFPVFFIVARDGTIRHAFYGAPSNLENQLVQILEALTQPKG